MIATKMHSQTQHKGHSRKLKRLFFPTAIPTQKLQWPNKTVYQKRF